MSDLRDHLAEIRKYWAGDSQDFDMLCVTLIRGHMKELEAAAEAHELGRIEGAKAMQEAAAAVCDSVESGYEHHSHTLDDHTFYEATEACEAAIRALDPETIAKGRP